MGKRNELRVESTSTGLFIVVVVFSALLLNALQAEQVTPLPSPSLSPEVENKDLASEAMDQKLPKVSASILRTKLQHESDPTKHQALALRLAQILASEGELSEALAILESQELATAPDIALWKAQVLLALGKPSEASSLLESSTAKNDSNQDALNLVLARCYRALGNYEKALELLNLIPHDSPLAPQALEERCIILLALKKNLQVEQLLKNLPPETLAKQPRLAYFLALAAWQRGEPLEALKRFRMVPSGDAWLNAAVVSGIASCDIALKKTGDAQLLLEKYLQENPHSPQLAELTKQLEQIYLLENNNEITLFSKWWNDTSAPQRASYVLLPYARTMWRLGHVSKADALLLSFLKRFPNHPLAPEVRLELAESQLKQAGSNTDSVNEVLKKLTDNPSFPPNLRARYAFLRGLAEVEVKQFDRAKEDFKQAALYDPHLATDAHINEALLSSPQNLETLNVDATLHSFLTASKKNNLDHQTTPKFLETHPAIIPLSGTAQKKPALANDTEKNEYLALLNTDKGDRQSALEVIKKAPLFLKTHLESPFVAEVRMKLGEALLRVGKVRDARIEFERVARAEPTSALGRQALFLAAQAASRSMDAKSLDDAIMLLEQIAQNPKAGQDQWQARLEQASLKNAQALPLEAIAIYDQILASSEPQGELRYATQMAKGDTLNNLGTKDPHNYQAAITAWRDLANAPNVPAHWRNQALCKVGLMSEKIGDVDGALAAYYEALKTKLDQEPDLIWHDKAAFEAARVLESRQEWKEAIRLYQQIIDEKGARAAEAQARISKLRLENFLWEH